MKHKQAQKMPVKKYNHAEDYCEEESLQCSSFYVSESQSEQKFRDRFYSYDYSETVHGTSYINSSINSKQYSQIDH